MIFGENGSGKNRDKVRNAFKKFNETGGRKKRQDTRALRIKLFLSWKRKNGLSI